MERGIERFDAETDGTRKIGMGDQKFRYFPGRDLPHINNRRSPDFQHRYRFSELAKLWLRGDSFVTCTVNFEKGAADFG